MAERKYGDPVWGIVEERFPVAATKYGKVVGETTDKVAIFRGIPYGGDVSRRNRFLPAPEPECWNGVKDCTKNGPACVQTLMLDEKAFGPGSAKRNLGLEYETQDENCLCLNVLTPGLDAKKRLVLVYIHGGGYWQYSGTSVLGAHQMAREQDVVLVSINHRLHVFGYLYLGFLDEKYRDSGNVGHLDLIMALKWIRDNITAFGGDPECVTLIGESGGALKIEHLLHMPEAQGLFHRAIALDTSMPVGRITKEFARKHTLKVLEMLEVSPDNLDKLLELPARYIVNTVFAEDTGLWGALCFGPVADDIHLTAPVNRYAPGEGLGNVPLIMGYSEDDQASFSAEMSLGVTEENLRDKLMEYGVHRGLSIDESNVDAVIETFRRNNDKNDDPGHMLLHILSCLAFNGNGCHYQAEEYADSGRTVYFYTNRYDAPNAIGEGKRFAGHVIHLGPGFRMVDFPEMEEYSKTIAAAYAAFMRTGDPSTPELEWPRFEAEHKYTMIYDEKFEVKSDPAKEMREILEWVNGGKRVSVNPHFELEWIPASME